MINIQIEETTFRINLATDMGRRLLIKNPSCKSSVADDRTTLEYRIDEIVALTSLLKYKRCPNR